MRRAKVLSVALGVLLCASLAPVSAFGQDQPPKVQIPQPGVPQVMTMEGMYVRAAYNNEGYAIIGYRAANQSMGEEWMLLEFGATLRAGVKDYTLTRDKLSIETPDGKTIPLASQSDYQKADVRALDMRTRAIHDSINYFPPDASRACRIGFFAQLGSPAMPWDEVEMSSTRACLGRLYFRVPGGIQYGQHWLNVQFRDTLVRVPFRILTKDEEKTLDKNYKSIEKQVKEAFAPKKK